MHGVPFRREPPGCVRSVAASYLQAGNHFRKLGSTVRIDAAQDIWRGEPCGPIVRETVTTTGGAARELRVFLFLVVVLAPALTVGLIGALGLGIWIVQMIAGPPGPPAG